MHRGGGPEGVPSAVVGSEEPHRSPEQSVDVVIVTRNRPSLIARAIPSVLASDHLDLILTVTDQSDDDETRKVVEAFAAEDDRVRYVPLDTVGSSRARNAAIDATSCPIVLFTDDDCVVDSTWVSEMLAEFTASAPAAVFGRLDPDTSDQPADAAEAPWLGVAVTEGEERRTFEPGPRETGFGHGANMGFRRDALEAVAGFDPLLGTGGPLRSWPERDIGYRVSRQGGTVVFTPEAGVSHSQWRTWPEVYDVHRSYSYGAGAACVKYMRCGQYSGLLLLLDWLVQIGFRQMASGAVRWRDLRKVRLGGIAIVWSLRGVFGGLRRPVDRTTVRYVDTDAASRPE